MCIYFSELIHFNSTQDGHISNEKNLTAFEITSNLSIVEQLVQANTKLAPKFCITFVKKSFSHWRILFAKDQ